MGKLTFFFDRNCGTRLPRSLARAQPPFNVEWHQKAGFEGSLPDDQWLKTVGESDWIVVSHDRKFHSETVEAAAIHQFSVGCFYLPFAEGRLWDKLTCFIRAYPKMQDRAAGAEKPFIYDIDTRGRLREVAIPVE